MSKIAFFCIPAHGHTNPTLGVVRELVQRGNEVWYYSYNTMKEKIENTGAKFISCDNYDIQMNLEPKDADRIGKDIVFSMEVLVNTTLAMEDSILREMCAWKPDVIVGDSMAAWAKLTAMKLQIPFVCSTTTFAFNRYSSQVMKQSFGEMIRMLFSMQKAKKVTNRLKEKGYPIHGVLDVIQNDNDTNTVVYTSPEFQPYSETFSDKYRFVGPSIRPLDYEVKKPEKTTIYISLGTVNNQRMEFFKRCIRAFEKMDVAVILSVGDVVDLEEFKTLPNNIRVERSVNQMEVLQQADAFLTHCGMNSVNEALYYEVPLVLYPQTTEQQGVANRVKELGAGIFLEDDSIDGIKQAIQTILETPSYRENAKKISESFHRCGGAKAAADFILEVKEEASK